MDEVNIRPECLRPASAGWLQPSGDEVREVLRRAGIGEAVTQGKYLRVSPVQLRDSQAMRLKRLHPGAVIKAAVRQVLVPLPLTQRIGGAPLTDGPLLEWVEALVTRILTPFRE